MNIRQAITDLCDLVEELDETPLEDLQFLGARGILVRAIERMNDLAEKWERTLD